jgi:iron(III) transport system permease protein
MPSIAFAAISILAMWSNAPWHHPLVVWHIYAAGIGERGQALPVCQPRGHCANMMQIGVELEEAADIAARAFGAEMARIISPLAKQGFISGFMLVFISIANELDLIILLMTPENRTLSYIAFTYSRDGLPQMSDAISVCVLLFVLVSYWLAHKFGKADIGKSWGRREPANGRCESTESEEKQAMSKYSLVHIDKILRRINHVLKDLKPRH